LFQSAHPRGVRLQRNNPPSRRKSFNPRTRAGCDEDRRVYGGVKRSFNPRTRAGCDGWTQDEMRFPEEFQSAHPRGVRPLTQASAKSRVLFQSAHPRGVRRIVMWMIQSSAKFQSAHPRGVRRRRRTRSKARSGFNPRTRAGCDRSTSDGPISPVVSIRAPARGATKGRRFRRLPRLFQSAHPRGVRLLHHTRRKEQMKSADSREPTVPMLRCQEMVPERRSNSLIYKDKEHPRTNQRIAGRFRFALSKSVDRRPAIRKARSAMPHTIKGASKSRAGFTPTCSIRRRPPLPKK
jgi:hypothetical protein